MRNGESSWNTTRLDENKLAKISQQDLYTLLHESNWNRLDQNARLQILQELENRQAELDNRPALKVCVKEMSPGLMGQHGVLTDGSEVIYLNALLVKESKLFSSKNESIYNAAAAVNTLMHEGRHSFQYHSIMKKSAGVPERQRLEWQAVMAACGGLYEAGDKNIAIYFAQSIEMDARRFARQRVTEISRVLQRMDAMDRNFVYEEAKNLELERRVVAHVRKALTLPMLEKYEKQVLEHLGRMQPELKLDKLSVFDDARFILSQPDVLSEDELVRLLDLRAKEKLSLKDGSRLCRLDHVKG